jgi:hypothetical protein
LPDLIELLGKVKPGDPTIEVLREILLLAEITRMDTDSPIEGPVKIDSPIEKPVEMDSPIKEPVETAKRIADDDPVILQPPAGLGIDEFEVELAPIPIPNNEVLLRTFTEQYSIVALIAGMKSGKNRKSEFRKSVIPSEFNRHLRRRKEPLQRG